MAESGSPRHSSDSDDEYNLILSSLLSSEVREELRLSWLSLQMEVLPYRFEPDLLGTDINDSLTLLPFHLKSRPCTLIMWKYRLVSLFMNAI